MKAIKFKECNHKFAEEQDEYYTLPGHIQYESPKQFTFCMQLTFRERVRILFTGKLWCGLLTFGKPLQPSRFSVKKSDLIPGMKKKE